MGVPKGTSGAGRQSQTRRSQQRQRLAGKKAAWVRKNTAAKKKPRPKTGNPYTDRVKGGPGQTAFHPTVPMPKAKTPQPRRGKPGNPTRKGANYTNVKGRRNRSV